LSYKFRKYTNIVIFDRENKRTDNFSIDDSNYINILNSNDSITLGTIINKIYRGTDTEYLQSLKSTKPISTPVIDDVNEEELSSSTENDDSDSTDSEFEYSKDYN